MISTCRRYTYRKGGENPRPVVQTVWGRGGGVGHDHREIIVRGQSYGWRFPKYWPPIPLTARRVCTPAFGAGGRTHLLGGDGGGRSMFWKTSDTALYSTYVSTLLPWWRLVWWHNKQADEPNDIGRNFLLGNRKKIAKFLMRTFTCRSTFLYDKITTLKS